MLPQSYNKSTRYTHLLPPPAVVTVARCLVPPLPYLHLPFTTHLLPPPAMATAAPVLPSPPTNPTMHRKAPLRGKQCARAPQQSSTALAATALDHGRHDVTTELQQLMHAPAATASNGNRGPDALPYLHLPITAHLLPPPAKVTAAISSNQQCLRSLHRPLPALAAPSLDHYTSPYVTTELQQLIHAPAATASDGNRGPGATPSPTKLVIATGMSNSAWSGAFCVPFHTCARVTCMRRSGVLYSPGGHREGS